LQPDSSLPAPSPYAEQTDSLTERREPESRPASLVRAIRTGRRIPHPRPPPVPGTHIMALRPSSVPMRFPLPSPASSRADSPDPESNFVRAASPTVTRLLASVVSDPSFESAVASALIAELVHFAAACRLDYAASLVAESKSNCHPSVGGECALGTDVLEDMQEDFECLAAVVPHLVAMLLASEGDSDAPDIPTPRSYTDAITDAVPALGANIVDGMWIFRVKRPPGSPPVFKARYVARGFCHREGVYFFQTFSPTPKMTTLRVLLHVAAQCDNELHSLDFRTAFLQGNLHEEIWLHRPRGFTGPFPACTQWSVQRPVYSLRQAPREWHNTLRTTLAALGFAPSTATPSLFLRTDTSLPPSYVLVSFSASASGTPRHSPLLCLSVTRSELHLRTSPTSGMGLVLGGRGPVVLTGHVDTSWVDNLAMQRSSQGYTFNLGPGSVSWRSTRSSSILSSSCEAEIYAGAMAAQEIRWLTYLLTDLGEQPRSSPVLYVDNKAMIALCREHRLEHKTKHITLRYFLSRELQQRGQLRLAYMAIRANTADIFSKALQPGDHQPFCTVLGLGVTCDGHHQPVALHLNGLGLAGEIPVEINQIATLTFLDLGRNTLSGVIPDSINNILSLQVLNLCNNRLGGRIPELNLVTKLFSLDLSRNQLGDAIPASLGLLTKLKVLELNNNELAGSIPDAVGNLKLLQDVSLAENRLTGRVPKGLDYLRASRTAHYNFSANGAGFCGTGFTGLT
ncbi:unnamed protein product, partial [Closterium sp. NIES-53]